MRVALEVRVAEDVPVVALLVLAVLAVERPTALVERVLVLLDVLVLLVLLDVLVLLVLLGLLDVLVVAPDVLVVAPDVLVVLPNVLRAVAGVAVRAEVRVLVRVVVVLRISRALVRPLLRRAKERSGCAVAYSLRPTFRCKS